MRVGIGSNFGNWLEYTGCNKNKGAKLHTSLACRASRGLADEYYIQLKNCFQIRGLANLKAVFIYPKLMDIKTKFRGSIKLPRNKFRFIL